MAIPTEKDVSVHIQPKSTFPRVPRKYFAIAVALILVVCITAALTIQAGLFDASELDEKRIANLSQAKKGQSSKSQGIAFIGNYNNMEPTEEQMEALDALLEKGVKDGYITSDFKLYGARQWQATHSPGQKLYERLKKHKHCTMGKVVAKNRKIYLL